MTGCKPYSSIILAFAGVLLSIMGLYFIFLRPRLLPEDLHYMGTTWQNVQENIPRLLNWLQKIFWAMGGYIFTTGSLIVFISFTSFRKRMSTVFGLIVLAGISSIGLMTVVNFMIRSDFKWLLLVFNIPWLIALILYLFKK